MDSAYFSPENNLDAQAEAEKVIIFINHFISLYIHYLVHLVITLYSVMMYVFSHVPF